MPGMSPPTSPIERAFELARSGEFANVSDIKKRLKAEGHDWRHLEGAPVLARQLRRHCVAARRDMPVENRRSSNPEGRRGSADG